MESKGGYFWHRTFICALFIAGNALITLPSKDGINASFLDWFCATVVGITLAVLFSLVIKKAKDNKSLQLLSLVFLPFLFYCFLDCCRDYVIFTDSTKMPNTSAAIIAVIFTVLSIYCGTKKRDTLLRLSVILFLVAALILLFLTLLSLPLVTYKEVRYDLSFDGIYKLLLKAFIPNLAVVYFINYCNRDTFATSLGTTLGAVVLLLILTLNTFVLGNVTNIIKYPLASLGGTISIGKGFSRYEGFIYLLIMITCFIKSSVSVFLIKKLSKNLHQNFYKIVLFLLPVLAVFFSLMSL